jgi:hypothetical protein
MAKPMRYSGINFTGRQKMKSVQHTVTIPFGGIDAELKVDWFAEGEDVTINSVHYRGEPLPYTLIDDLFDDITDEIEKQIDSQNQIGDECEGPV